MSIESSLKSIAESLQQLLALAKDGPLVGGLQLEPDAAPAAAAPAAAAPAAAAPAAAAPAAAASMTMEELNAALLSEYARLGNDRTGIDASIKDAGATTVTDLPSAKYQEVLDAVKAFAAPVA